MNKKKVLKIVGVVLLVIVLAFIIYVIRNTIIITKLQNNIKEYTSKTNYNIKVTTTDMKNETTMTVNNYKKDNKELVILERSANDNWVKMSFYNNGERRDRFVETKDSKTAQVNISTELIGLQITDALKTDNLWQTILCSAITKIKSTNVNGKDCYKISEFYSPYWLYGNNITEDYIEKDTGLLIKSVIDNEVAVREYEFDNVDDSVFIEPDIGQYRIQENNN